VLTHRPEEAQPFAEIVRETPRQEGETFAAWVRRIWDEKYDTKCPQSLTDELLEKLSRGSQKNGKRNLPPSEEPLAKSFRST